MFVNQCDIYEWKVRFNWIYAHSTDITISSATAAVPVQTHQVPAAAFNVMVSMETPRRAE